MSRESDHRPSAGSPGVAKVGPQGRVGCVHLAVPVFLLVGGITGFRFGYQHGLGWGLLAAVGGVLAGFATFVAVLLLLVGGIALAEKLTRRKA